MNYSGALKKNLAKKEQVEKLHKREELKFKEREKELYSKVCVAGCINFAVCEASNENIETDESDKFSFNLATILARDREVVAVRLDATSDGYKVYLSKNSHWDTNDLVYISKIEKYLKTISNNAPTKQGVKVVGGKALVDEIKAYCYTKIKSRFNKLKLDIVDGQKRQFHYIKSFMDFASINVGEIDEGKEGLYGICKICYKYYKLIKEDPSVPPKFKGHIKKMGVYVGSVIHIIDCANSAKFKPVFSNFELRRMKPIIIPDQPTSSWKDIIKEFTDGDEYKTFTEKCLKKPFTVERMRETYTDPTTQQFQLEGDDIKRRVYLHAEMNILTSVINQEIKKKKIYNGWKHPHVVDKNFSAKSLEYLLGNLDLIIENKIKQVTSSVKADSDSTVDSMDANNGGSAGSVTVLDA